MAEASDPSKPDSCNNVSGDEEDELERLAVEELVNEAKRAKERSQTMGTYGWEKRKATTNKRFLHSTLVSTLRSYGTDSRHRQKRYGHGSGTVESERSKPITDNWNAKSSHDVILKEPNQDSTSLGTLAGEADDDHPERRDARPSHLDGGFIRGSEPRDSKSNSSDSERTHNHNSHRYETTKHRKRTRSTSPPSKEAITSDDDGHRRGHHRHGKRSKSSKHKRKSKHKDRHSRSDSHRNSRRQEKR
ncbi:uncharacterized protein LOC119727177 [Patiria miniata]|uniref:Uncharacterized protein n=1 Tax=Patiria miniata TaxID=46514 RepID=A0A913ZTN8_PATMI|nr:uncharacterized protein LOC119727177 [Patiria miniata]